MFIPGCFEEARTVSVASYDITECPRCGAIADPTDIFSIKWKDKIVQVCGNCFTEIRQENIYKED